MLANSSRRLLAARTQARVAAARVAAWRREVEIRKFAGVSQKKEFLARTAWRGSPPPSHLPRRLGLTNQIAGRAIQSAQAAAHGAHLDFFFGRAGARATRRSIDRSREKGEKDDFLGEILIAAARSTPPAREKEIDAREAALSAPPHGPAPFQNAPPPPAAPGGRSLPTHCLTPRLLSQRPQLARQARAGIIFI